MLEVNLSTKRHERKDPPDYGSFILSLGLIGLVCCLERFYLGEWGVGFFWTSAAPGAATGTDNTPHANGYPEA